MKSIRNDQCSQRWFGSAWPTLNMRVLVIVIAGNFGISISGFNRTNQYRQLELQGMTVWYDAYSTKAPQNTSP
eukprot:scaffold402644_cov28-Prasinocladus_malaysianus.AAC.1